MVANFWFMEAAIWSCKLLMERFTAGTERGHYVIERGHYVINYCTYDPDWDVMCMEGQVNLPPNAQQELF